MIDVTPLAKAAEQLSSAIQEQALEPQRCTASSGIHKDLSNTPTNFPGR